MLRYRPEIDGLRSVAILPILLFHAGVSVLRGGYTGVDVFFVISGFLITRIIIGELKNKSFSLKDFYKRRIARIFPPLIFMLLFVGFLTPYIFVIPENISEVHRSIAAAAAFYSNIYFWIQVGYFSHAAESQPLLHTWSLGVEEQFYIFYPLLLWSIRKLSLKKLKIVLGIVAIISFLSGLALQYYSPSSTFYLFPFRTWELILGGLIGLNVAPKLGLRTQTMVACTGAGLLAVSFIFLVSWLPFPSPFAIFPCVGTALIIAYGEATIVGRALSWYPVRWVGKISYSLYLWHWPIITFYRQLTGDALDWKEAIILIAASLLIASGSYYLIERPFHARLKALPARQTISLGFVATSITLVLSLVTASIATRAWPIKPEAARIAAYENYVKMKHDKAWNDSVACFVAEPSQNLNANCLAVIPGKRNVVLLGDSHANMYAASLRRTFPQIGLQQATYFGCPPVINGSHDRGCQAMIDKVIGPLASSRHFQGIILASRWRAEQMGSLTHTIQLLRSKGLDVAVIGPVAEYEGSFPILLARAAQSGNMDTVRRFLSPKSREIDMLVQQTALSAGAKYYSAYEIICPKQFCRLLAPDGTPMHFDYGHLTDPGAQLIIDKIPDI